MLHRGKAHTYDLGGPFGVAYGASIVWFIGSLLFALALVVKLGFAAAAFVVPGLAVSWVLGLIAFSHRRRVWPLLVAESAALVIVLFAMFV